MFRIFKNEILMAAALGLFVAVSCGQPVAKNAEVNLKENLEVNLEDGNNYSLTTSTEINSSANDENEHQHFLHLKYGSIYYDGTQDNQDRKDNRNRVNSIILKDVKKDSGKLFAVAVLAMFVSGATGTIGVFSNGLSWVGVKDLSHLAHSYIPQIDLPHPYRHITAIATTVAGAGFFILSLSYPIYRVGKWCHRKLLGSSYLDNNDNDTMHVNDSVSTNGPLNINNNKDDNNRNSLQYNMSDDFEDDFEDDFDALFKHREKVLNDINELIAEVEKEKEEEEKLTEDLIVNIKEVCNAYNDHRSMGWVESLNGKNEWSLARLGKKYPNNEVLNDPKTYNSKMDELNKYIEQCILATRTAIGKLNAKLDNDEKVNDDDLKRIGKNVKILTDHTTNHHKVLITRLAIDHCNLQQRMKNEALQFDDEKDNNNNNNNNRSRSLSLDDRDIANINTLKYRQEVLDHLDRLINKVNTEEEPEPSADFLNDITNALDKCKDDKMGWLKFDNDNDNDKPCLLKLYNCPDNLNSPETYDSRRDKLYEYLESYIAAAQTYIDNLSTQLNENENEDVKVDDDANLKKNIQILYDAESLMFERFDENITALTESYNDLKTKIQNKSKLEVS